MNIFNEYSTIEIYLVKNVKLARYFQVAWKDQSIVVFDDVIIKPPYRKEDVNGRPDSRQLLFVKKIVEKFIVDQET